ncbi:hypothetical protein GOODEAATRI_004990 [Goodea atripinnis]|uniref:Uncharacterized protein n=1 Tax=Goodea atripinnis TaxID=208336 RepID=A0ABV0MF62_9TELE
MGLFQTDYVPCLLHHPSQTVPCGNPLWIHFRVRSCIRHQRLLEIMSSRENHDQPLLDVGFWPLYTLIAKSVDVIAA